MNNAVWKILGGIFALLVLVRIFNISYPIDIHVVNTSQASEFSVVGEGKIDVVPDTAIIDAGITVSNIATADQAKEQMTKINNAIIDSVKSLGVKKEDIQTSNFSVNPEYSYGGPVQIQTFPVRDSSKISGYSGNATITVKVHNKNVVSQVVDKITAAGATNINGPRFTVENPEQFREQARQKAIDNAKEQAQKLSHDLGISLGKITNMVESGPNSYPVYAQAGMMSATAATKDAVTTPTFEEGTQTVTSTITLFFEKK